jgi:hypothetical protein
MTVLLPTIYILVQILGFGLDYISSIIITTFITPSDRARQDSQNSPTYTPVSTLIVTINTSKVR